MELLKISMVANLATALSYIWIPIAVFLYLQRHSIDIPEWASGWPRLGVMFVLFCGFHHLLMVHHLAQEDTIGVWHVLIDLIMAFVSVLAAVNVRSFLSQVDRFVKVEFLDPAHHGDP